MKPTSVAAIILFLVLTVTGVSAQTCTDEELYDLKLAGVDKGGRRFNIFTTYCLKDLTAGRSVKVTVRIETEKIPGSQLLEIKDTPAVDNQDSGLISFSETDPESDDKDPLTIRKYKYTVTISDQAEPRNYSVKLNLGLPNEKEITKRDFELPVGVNSGGKLEISKESQVPTFQGAMFSTAQHEHTLKLRNFFRDYTAHVESITVNSDPPGWIWPTPIPLTEQDKQIKPTGDKFITFKFDSAELHENLLRGTPPQLKFVIKYNDGYGRELVYDEGRQPINISPSRRVLLGAVLAGLLFGAIVRAVIEFMYFGKRRTRNAVVRVVTYSLVFGLLVVILTAVGQVEVKSKAFSFSSSYDNPLAMLAIGLVSALAGLQIIIGWYKSLKSD